METPSAAPHQGARPRWNDRLILIVEDEAALAEAMRYNLEREGFSVRAVDNGRKAIEEFTALQPDLVLLDLMLPEVSGLDVCRNIRHLSTVPIIIVTAKDEEADKVAGLELGADDYVTKPFGMRELLSRVRAQLRRSSMLSGSDDVLLGGPVEIDLASHEVRVKGVDVSLPPKEYSLLTTLIENQGRLLTRDRLISEVWGADYFGDTKTLDVHIKRLRSKIEEDPKKPRHILTIRGFGYKFVTD